MEVGIDSFASGLKLDGSIESASEVITKLLDRIEHADKSGLDVFGLGEHYRKEFLDSASPMLLAAAASRTKNIKLTSAVTVLSAADPVRVFQNFATLDLVSQGRAEMVVGRGSFIESFPLFGLDLHDYDVLFIEKLDLLLKIRASETITWQGRFRPALDQQSIYPRPLQHEIPIWLGVGGTPESFARAGLLGMPLMVAIIGGETHRFRPLIDIYRRAGEQAGHDASRLKVGLHSLGYVADTSEQAVADYYPGYAKTFTKIGKERGWGPVTKEGFEAQRGPRGAFLVGSTEEVAEKILRHSEALGGISRVCFQMDNAGMPHENLMNAIHLIGTKIKPIIQDY